jgi:hypothetical protein
MNDNIAVCIQAFRPSGYGWNPDDPTSNAFAPLVRVDIGDYLDPNHDIVKRYPAQFAMVAMPSLNGETIAMLSELRQLTARLAAAGPETCPSCGEVNDNARRKLAARVEDVRARVAALSAGAAA